MTTTRREARAARSRLHAARACRPSIAARVAMGATLLATLALTRPANAGDFAFEYRPEWRRFELVDYVATASILTAYYAVEFGLSGPRGASWTQPLPPFDRPVRELTVAGTRAQREYADRAADTLWYGLVAYSVADALLVPTVRGGNFDGSLQLTMMTAQAYGVSSLLVRIPHKLVGRTRPLVEGCKRDPNYSAQCASQARFVSFFGGHVAISMTAAGLLCAHHLYGDLYGGGWPDTVVCSGALAAASAVGYYRLRGDKHWLSDQLLGAVVGLGSGFVLPSLVYYRAWAPSDRRTGASKPPARPRLSVLPLVSDDVLGLNLVVSN